MFCASPFGGCHRSRHCGRGWGSTPRKLKPTSALFYDNRKLKMVTPVDIETLDRHELIQMVNSIRAQYRELREEFAKNWPPSAPDSNNSALVELKERHRNDVEMLMQVIERLAGR